jgi:hypothetical protein
MRNFKKSQKRLWYALYKGVVPEIDENGDETGDNERIVYSKPVEFLATLSSGKGAAQKDVFGVDTDFTRTFSTVDISLPIDETTLIWHETEPVMLDDGTVDANSADYTVSGKPAVGSNVLVVALKARSKSKAV